MPTVRGFTLPTTGIARYGATSRAAGLTGGVRINVLGVKETLAKINTIGQVVYRDLGLIMFRSASFTKERSQEHAPEKTGALRRGHFIDKVGPYVYNVRVSTHDETGREYAGYQEFGYHDRGGNWHEGRGFLRQATAEGRVYAQAQLAALARKLEVL